jgi:hypothetical protein
MVNQRPVKNFKELSHKSMTICGDRKTSSTVKLIMPGLWSGCDELDVLYIRIQYVNTVYGVAFFIAVVSPAYSYVSLALVKCSNKGGPGPRYNRKEAPGSSTLTMLVGHGYHLYLMPLFSEAGDKEPVWTPSPPPQTNLGRAPSLPLQVHTPPLAKMKREASLSGNHTSASDWRSEAMDWARGGCGDHFGLFSASLQGQTAEIETTAG